FDYLFAITHLSILPADVLAKPQRAAINFHDGPLPKYAGLNAPVWALINREREYGITWHRMTAGIDDGEILKQRRFEIAPHEVSLTLNTRNFEAAIESFGELVDELAADTVQPLPQDFVGRVVYSKHDRPAAGCLLDWNRTADELDALIRATTFGRYPNPIGLAHFKQGHELIAVTKCEIADESVAVGEPGLILTIDDERIRVSTRQGALDLLGFAQLNGEALTLDEVVRRLHLAAGEPLDRLSLLESERLTQLLRRLVRSESFWTQRLKQLDPATIPYTTVDTARETLDTFAEARIVLSEWFTNEGTNRVEQLLTAVGAFLARSGEKDTLDVAFASDELRQTIAGNELWVAPHVPLRIAIDAQADLETQQAIIAAELARVQKHVTYTQDLVGRYPELHENRALATGRHLPVLIDVRESLESFEPVSACPLAIVISPNASHLRLVYNSQVVSSEAAATIQRQLQTMLADIATQPQKPLGTLDILSAAEKQRVLVDFNATEAAYRHDVCVHELIEEQVRLTPEATAVVSGPHSLTYAELNSRANRLARQLRDLGVGPDRLVGVCLERSVDLAVAILAVHKAGGAYVPLDPQYPADRVALMIEDSAVPVIITQEILAEDLPPHEAHVLCIDTDWPTIAEQDDDNLAPHATSANLAYVIYTSGSTGKPKGVMIEHRNVVNFFLGMDQRVPHSPPGVWLAVTSLSFDISVLELLWTLSHGFKVVIFRGHDHVEAPIVTQATTQPIDFSLFYFSAEEIAESSGIDKYRLLIEGAKFADEHSFNAVWTPERHFHAFGGLYPNPAVTGAAVAVLTKHVQIRAGSVVLPLHHPIRVAEAWSIVDNLSNGRVAIAFAAGWQPTDFVLMPQNYANAKDVMFRDIDLVQRLWRGESVEFPGATGNNVSIRTLPRPVQGTLPTWITTAGNVDTYIAAGRIGANVLTHLLGQSVEEITPKIAAYRQARAEAGFDPDTGIVSLMLHTFVGSDDETVRNIVRGPMKAYLGTSLSLLKKYAWAFPAFKRPKDMSADLGNDFESLTPDEQEAVLEHAFERYFVTSGLFGRPETCLEMVEKLKAIGVNEIACLIDFGAPEQAVLDSLPYLNQVRQMSNPCPLAACATTPNIATPAHDESIPGLIRRYGVTHFQCTPSMARMLLGTDAGREAFRHVRIMMVGGEAFPLDVAKELTALVADRVVNMYGPTETTVWSTTHDVTGAPEVIPIGRPIANTSIYILDRNGQPAPIGVVGELLIGGDGVVRGYLNRPELTAERFVSDPFANTPGARMYRTGDLARWREDGVIEFLGRADHQVKIRGYRIELGEIEARLGDHPAVHQAVVVAREVAAGDQRLVAYVVPQGKSPEVDELRESLRRTLPDFMVPSHVVFLSELPLTPNGKIDRKSLPALDVQAPAAPTTTFVEASNELETSLVKAWQEVLAREQIGIDDNFFDIGGHSLLVVRLHRLIAKSIEQPVSLTDLYRFPTIRALASYLSGDTANVGVQQSAARGAKRREAMHRRRQR
ncbi:MAG: LLM class flavin-dependent oxidoreductase, partial [Planctomycetaceae bacterium]|nr:LLM class flavin-dependent oxidoreductase [Planctomycetaceae bacterium]